MPLGASSISLAVKDLESSRAFYEKFGFNAFAGDASQNWLILKNGNHVKGRAVAPVVDCEAARPGRDAGRGHHAGWRQE